jgi:hypothetical protein
MFINSLPRFLAMFYLYFIISSPDGLFLIDVGDSDVNFFNSYADGFNPLVSKNFCSFSRSTGE